MERETNVRSLRKLLNNKIDSRKLQPGDHIYAYRGMHLYSHHGIYVGKKQVIHYITTEPKPKKGNPCPKCGFQNNVHLGVVKSCLDCFLSEGSHFAGHFLRRYQYNVPESWYRVKRAGSCSTYASKPPNEVIETATRLLKDNGFGEYNLIENNCEDFATYCKTGIPKSAQAGKPVMSFFAGVASAVAGIVVGGSAASYLMITNTGEKKMTDDENHSEAAKEDDDDDVLLADDDDDEYDCAVTN